MKKRIGSVLLALALCLSLLPTAALAEGDEGGATTPGAEMPTYSGGSGTAEDPYLLSSKEDILALQEYLNNLDEDTYVALDKVDQCGLGGYHGYYFRMTKDIDMSSVTDWVPFNFCGTLDGAGHTISNLQLNQNFFESADPNNNEYKSQEYEAAFFSQLVHAHIKNLYFENCTATVSNGLKPESERDIYAAIVAGTAIASSFENISVMNCTVTQNGAPTNLGYAAGLVGYADICHISNCSVQGGSINVGGDAVEMYTGGLVGAIGDTFNGYKDDYNMTVGAGDSFGVFDCFSTAAINVTCINYGTGGLIGLIECDTLTDTYENCIVGGTVTSAAYRTAGLIGTCYSDVGTALENCVVYSDSIQGGTCADPLYCPYSDSLNEKITVTGCKVSDGTKVSISNADAGSVTNNAVLTPEALSETDCQVERFKSNLYGSLTDGSADVIITLSQNDEEKYTAVTDADGGYNFGKQVLPGSYTLTIDGNNDFGAYTGNIDINYAENKNEDISRTATKRPSSGSSSSRPSYPITTPDKTENGSVNISSTSAKRGSIVTITVTPDAGYVLDELTVTDKDGKELSLTKKSDTEYTFVMPAGKVEITPSFVKQAEEPSRVFVDVKTGDYFYDAVLWAVEKGITNGTSAETFSPEDPCTRAQIVTFLWRAAGSPVVNYAMDLSDVAGDAYYAEAVRWALSEGITTGTSADQFSPDAVCTREQAVTFLWRAAGSPAVSGESAFEDVGADDYYARAVAWAAQNGVTNGISQALFGTGSDCTRAQIVTFLYRAQQGK